MHLTNRRICNAIFSFPLHFSMILTDSNTWLHVVCRIKIEYDFRCSNIGGNFQGKIDASIQNVYSQIYLFNSSKSGKGKFSRRGFKRKRQSNGSGKKFTRKNSNTNEAKNKGPQYNSIVSGGSTGIRSNAVSGSKGIKS